MVGFDTSHLGDSRANWSEEDVWAETVFLEQQLTKMSNNLEEIVESIK